MRTFTMCFALVLAACAREGEPAAAPPQANLFVSVGGSTEQRPPAGFVGTWIDIESDVSYRQTLVIAAGRETQRETSVNGHPFAVADGWITIGAERYGPVPVGARVVISGAGVFADGVKLGALPERTPPASAEE